MKACNTTIRMQHKCLYARTSDTFRKACCCLLQPLMLPSPVLVSIASCCRMGHCLGETRKG